MASKEVSCKILQLSDCTLMYILEYLDATSLYMLSRTCLYFKNIIEDPKLWRYVDARAEPNKTKKVDYVVNKVHEKTTHLMIRALSREEGLVSHKILLGFAPLRNLTILALENQKFDGRKIDLNQFPRNLTELSLRKTFVKYSKAFFHRTSYNMKKLRVLILDECSWIEGQIFMSISNYPSLEILSIVKCLKLHVNIIAYLTISRNGFQEIKIIDSRLNTIANDLLSQSWKQLRAMYFQSMRSYQLDTGKSVFKTTRSLSVEEVNEFSIQNESLRQYPVMIPDNIVEELPHSVLYQDPYPDCTCGSKDRKNEEPIEDTPIADEPSGSNSKPWLTDDFIQHRASPTSFICRRHFDNLRTLPKEFKTIFSNHQKQLVETDEDSDSDEDCCMFGVGRTQQMIVLKLRDADGHGNIPIPEIIELNRMVNVDLNPSVIVERLMTNEHQPQPSTSRDNANNVESRPRLWINRLPRSSSSPQSEEQPSSSSKEPETTESSQICDPVLPSSSKQTDPQPSCSKDIDPEPSCSGTSDSRPSGSRDCDLGPSTPGPSKRKSERSSSSSPAKRKVEDTSNHADVAVIASPEIHVSFRKKRATLGGSKRKTENQDDTDSKRSKTDNGNVENDGEQRLNEDERRIAVEANVEVEQRRPHESVEEEIRAGRGNAMTRRIYRCGMIFDENPQMGRGQILRVNRREEDPTVPIKLRRLSLRGYKGISDEGLRHIKHLNLDLLDVTHTQVTKQGIEQFLIDNPNCRIIHRNYCVCKPRIPV